MLKAIRKRVSATSVMAFLALVLAMTGGAYAAGAFKITSIKQISPKVVKQLKGQTGARGPAGPAGAAGAQGPAGLQGTAGKDGTNGTNGTPGESVTLKEIKTTESACKKHGGTEVSVGASSSKVCNGEPGEEGNPWTPNSQLPVGATETGTWAVGPAVEPGPFYAAPATFTIQLAPKECEGVKQGLCATDVHFINTEGNEQTEVEGPGVPPSPACPGNVEEPKATSGNLCIYAGKMENAKLANGLIFTPGGKAGAGVTGVTVFVVSEGNAKGSGSWAVTG